MGITSSPLNICFNKKSIKSKVIFIIEGISSDTYSLKKNECRREMSKGADIKTLIKFTFKYHYNTIFKLFNNNLENVKSPSSLGFPCLGWFRVLDDNAIEGIRVLGNSKGMSTSHPVLLKKRQGQILTRLFLYTHLKNNIRFFKRLYRPFFRTKINLGAWKSSTEVRARCWQSAFKANQPW